MNPADKTLETTRDRLLAELGPDGCWEGNLSSSALATALASFALLSAGREETALRGLEWIASNSNTDGGWGDSPDSPSNLTATLLCWCSLSQEASRFGQSVRDAERWLRDHVGGVDTDRITGAILRYYGNDRTFSAPILTCCRLTGTLPDWSYVPQLPFEFAAFPHQLYRWLHLGVVSYALPALIAIGLVRHRHAPSGIAPLTWFRNRMTPRVLEILRGLQPESGGFLEAAPLTSFVAMSLAGAGFGDHSVTQSCVRFLENTVREDGSWPIEVHLSTWLTSLAVDATADELTGEQKDRIRGYLLDTQRKAEHPFTHAAPGGWGWNAEAGAVPDTDDTSAALIALHRLGRIDDSTRSAAEKGIRWLLQLQNNDGGWPTFCRGWGKLPFDRSCPALTAHAIRAFVAWQPESTPTLLQPMRRAVHRAVGYLQESQRPNGSWIPLWFGNQYAPGHENPVFGTARVATALKELDPASYPAASAMQEKAIHWLSEARNPDGGWSGAPNTPSSVEETALAVGVLAATLGNNAVGSNVHRLVTLTEEGTRFPPTPIGLYFASLWYSERLYPVIFTAEALRRVHERVC